MAVAVTLPSAIRTTAWKTPTRVDFAVLAGLLVVALAIIAALAPHWLTSVDPFAADPLAALQAPSSQHLAGTDALGRDLLARIIYGARYSLSIGLGATLVGLAAGALLGLTAGVGPRWLDAFVSRTVDVVASFPELLLALVLIAFTGPGVGNLILALGVAGIPKYARLVRSQVRQAAASGYVEQARTFGLGRIRLVWRHVLPNALGSVPIVATIGLGGAIIGAASLSFIGMGPQPPTPEWGSMLADSRSYLRVAWWVGVFPGLALVATIVSSTVLGRRLQARYERRNG